MIPGDAPAAHRPGWSEEGPKRFASRGIAIRRAGLSRWLGLLSKLGLVKLLVLLSIGANPGMIGLSFIGFVSFVLASVAARMVNVENEGSVTVDETAVTILTTRVHRTIPRAHVRAAIATTRVIAGAVPVHAVEITTRARGLGGDGDVVRVRTRDREEADALVRELGFGPGQRRVAIDFASPARPLLHVFLLFPAFVLANILSVIVLLVAQASGMGHVPVAMVGPLFFAAFFAAFEIVKRGFRAQRWVVGDDGVLVERAFGKTWVKREGIAKIKNRGLALAPVILRTNGAQLVPPRGAGIDHERVHAAVEALERRLATREPKPNAPELARGERSVRALREELRQRIEQPTYREAAATTETAEALMKSPDASLDERVAAAMALRIAGEPAAKIRVAADAFVDDATREALEAVADDDDARVERALLSSRREPR